MKIVTTASTQRKRCLFAHILNLCRTLSASTRRTYRCAPSRSFVFAACSQCSLFHGPVLPPSPRLVPKLHMCLNRIPRMEPLSMTKPKRQTIISTPLSTNLPSRAEHEHRAGQQPLCCCGWTGVTPPLE